MKEKHKRPKRTGPSSKGEVQIADHIIEYIYSLDDNDLGRLRVSLMAKTFGTTRFRISQQFRRKKNIKISDFITKVKMHRAAELLVLNENEKTTMINLSKQLGYKSAEYFVRLFKEYFFIHPKKYRKIKKR
jgi:two-component system response regulator YesN